jgi:uncharacterized membrane protein
MENTSIFSFNTRWNLKTISLFIVLLALPNLLGMINLSTPFGFRIHFFQLAVFIAAMIYGPMGGMLSGIVGSGYSAIAMSNPYILVGNAILGFFFGLFMRKEFNVFAAVLLAYAIQLPWLVMTDIYLVHMPLPVVEGLVVALLVSDLIWAATAKYLSQTIRKSFL